MSLEKGLAVQNHRFPFVETYYIKNIKNNTSFDLNHIGTREDKNKTS